VFRLRGFSAPRNGKPLSIPLHLVHLPHDGRGPAVFLSGANFSKTCQNPAEGLAGRRQSRTLHQRQGRGRLGLKEVVSIVQCISSCCIAGLPRMAASCTQPAVDEPQAGRATQANRLASLQSRARPPAFDKTSQRRETKHRKGKKKKKKRRNGERKSFGPRRGPLRLRRKAASGRRRGFLIKRAHHHSRLVWSPGRSSAVVISDDRLGCPTEPPCRSRRSASR